MSAYEQLKHANWAGRALGWGVRGFGNAILGAGRVGAEVMSHPVKWYGNKLINNPLGTVAGTAGIAVSAPYLYNRFVSDDYEKMINEGSKQHPLSWAPPKIASYGEDMNYTDKARQAYLEKKAVIKDLVSKSAIPLGVAIPAGILGWLGKDIVRDVTKPSTDIMGQNLARKLFPQETRLGLEDEAARAEASSRGKTIGVENANALLSEHTNKQYTKKEKTLLGPARNNLLKDLAKDDKIIMRGLEDSSSKKVIHDTMNTVRTFAPTLATDKKTLQSVLREALTSPEGGLSYQTIKQLADTQRSVSENKLPSLIED